MRNAFRLQCNKVATRSRRKAETSCILHGHRTRQWRPPTRSTLPLTATKWQPVRHSNLRAHRVRNFSGLVISLLIHARDGNCLFSAHDGFPARRVIKSVAKLGVHEKLNNFCCIRHVDKISATFSQACDIIAMTGHNYGGMSAESLSSRREIVSRCIVVDTTTRHKRKVLVDNRFIIAASKRNNLRERKRERGRGRARRAPLPSSPPPSFLQLNTPDLFPRSSGRARRLHSEIRRHRPSLFSSARTH